MTRFSDTLLATDRLARAIGCGGLHPDFRAAIEAQSRFPARPDDERQVG